MVPGLIFITLGLLALAIASVEYLVFAGIAAATGRGDGLFGLSFGTTAYIAGYAGAGAVFVVVGVWKVYRGRFATHMR